MNENIDLSKILRDVPKGTKFWSPVFGTVVLNSINDFVRGFTITVIAETGDYFDFNKNGAWYSDYGVNECLLFPSKDQRDWSKFEYVENYNNKEFTKGPWFIKPCHEGIEVYKRDLAIARVPITKDVLEEAKANARLISASPALLEALEPFADFPDEDFIEEEAELSYTLTVRVKDIIAAKKAIKEAIK